MFFLLCIFEILLSKEEWKGRGFCFSLPYFFLFVYSFHERYVVSMRPIHLLRFLFYFFFKFFFCFLFCVFPNMRRKCTTMNLRVWTPIQANIKKKVFKKNISVKEKPIPFCKKGRRECRWTTFFFYFPQTTPQKPPLSKKPKETISPQLF